ncbi:hypothetical protein BV25DRAFT_1602236 [Artomyces pyxidatus]|uniref:Uncharacterized protein n=1 Tax=Artomyces pyxidatus TaxID=48021 RepID=A0ACB8TAM8_9AGAM|nr:hypothetical protein BV25DRAFT_1602236 [Artomyces pyxidatus]
MEQPPNAGHHPSGPCAGVADPRNEQLTRAAKESYKTSTCQLSVHTQTGYSTSLTDMSDYPRDLNNYLQATRQAHLLTWRFEQTGPNNAALHTALALLNGQPIGTGTGVTRNIAKAAASHDALLKLGVIAA